MNLKSLKLILIVGLMLALLPLPYGYFTILRTFACVVFTLLLLQIPAKKRNSRNRDFIIYLILIILFQPLLKIPFGRILWNIIDIGTAIWLLWTLNKPASKPRK